MDTTYQPTSFEDFWRIFWANSFPRKEGSPFSIVMPPPNVTGKLHMGHALVNTLQDIMVRFARMQGKNVLWLPGTDHAGIATQTVVERRSMALYGKRRSDYTRQEFVDLILQWKDEHESQILHQLGKLGLTCAWEKKRFTMDSTCSKAVNTMFYSLFEKGLIYRGDYLVNWDPVTQTALADDEVEYEQEEGFLYFIRLGSLTIATTRPETMLGDTAIAVHPSDERYASLIGTTIVHPLTKMAIPIIADHIVDPEFGTGALKITPAHDPVDYELGKRHNLPMINILTSDGKINEAGAPFTGLTVTEAREAVVAKLKELGILEKMEPHTKRVGKSYRSKAVIEPYLSKQWFIRMEPFKKGLYEAIQSGETKLFPNHFEKVYFHWIDSLRDWCISRQIWWGHKIPVWYKLDDPSIMAASPDGNIPKEIAHEAHLWRQDEDVLDTWFSSALWPLSTLGWPEKTPDFDLFYPTSLLVTGHDILFFWVARMIMMGQYATGKSPFKEVFIHGLIYAKSYWTVGKDGSVQYILGKERQDLLSEKTPPKNICWRFEKMSKSKGNVIDPLDMIELYGTDALRLTLTLLTTDARQIDLDTRKFEESRNFINKIWNGSRFILMHLSEKNPLTKEEYAKGFTKDELSLDDRWILSCLAKSKNALEEALNSYHFDSAATIIYKFFWDELCAYYLETSKAILFGKEGSPQDRTRKQKILAFLLESILALFHPIIPFITEEIHRRFQEHFGLAPKSLAFETAYPTGLDQWIDEDAEACFTQVQDILRYIRTMRADMKIPPGTLLDLYLVHPKIETLHLLLSEQAQLMLRFLGKIEKVFLETNASNIPQGASSAIGDLLIAFPLPKELLEAEKERLFREIEKQKEALALLTERLSNREFTEKAPKALVEKQKRQAEDLALSIEQLALKHNALLKQG